MAVLALAGVPAWARGQVVGSNGISNLSTTLHPGRLADGDPVATYSRPDAWQEIQTGSSIELLAKFACDKLQQSGARAIRRWQGLDND